MISNAGRGQARPNSSFFHGMLVMKKVYGQKSAPSTFESDAVLRTNSERVPCET